MSEKNASTKVVRIGGASGFWGDSASAVPQLLKAPDLDYLTFDYLAELTMSILSRAKAKNPELGYAEDFVTVAMRSMLHDVDRRGIKVLSNAGGVNPRACAAALQALAKKEGVELKIAVVEGDDLTPQMEALRAAGVRDLHSGAKLPGKLMSANAYFGALPIVEALRQGAQIVITGRCVDSALPLAALVHEFGWKANDYDRLAAGSLVGHLIECGPQCTGGLFTDWDQVPGWDDIGYPLVEANADGSFVITKPAGTGGLVTPATVAEQMLYEIGDPSAYMLPDVCCDFTAVRMEQDGPDRVRVDGVRGRPPSQDYKVSATHADGWRCSVYVTLLGGRAEAKATRTAEAIIARTRRMFAERGLADYRRVHSEVLGVESTFGANSRVANNREVVLRLVVDHDERAALELFASEIAPGAVSWAPGMANIGGGRPRPTPIVRLFSFLWPKTQATPFLTIDGATTAVAVPPIQNELSPPKPAAVYGAQVAAAGANIETSLLRIAHGRSGDKGDSVNIGVLARDPKWVPVLQRELTAERVRAYFAHFVKGEVARFDVPGVHGFNFLLLGALDGGGMASPRSDPLGKAFAQMLLDMPIRVPADLLN